MEDAGIYAEPPSVRVVSAVADAKSVDPTDLDPLAYSVDLESVDALVANSSADVSVEIAFDELLVEIRPDGDVRVSPE